MNTTQVVVFVEQIWDTVHNVHVYSNWTWTCIGTNNVESVSENRNDQVSIQERYIFI